MRHIDFRTQVASRISALGVGALLALFAMVLLAAPALAESDLDAQTREVAKDLRCKICTNLSVADSQSDLAKDMRKIIREQLQQGKSRAEIEQYFVARYGEEVLLDPPKRGFNLFVWGSPVLLLVVGLLVLGFAVNKWSARRPAQLLPQPAADELAGYDELLREDREQLRGGSR
jgi:cytochrome c-type biogenesis protein CcmH